MEIASRIFQTFDALKSADPTVFHSGKGRLDAPGPTYSGWYLQRALPDSIKTYPQIKRLFLRNCTQLRSFTWVESFPNVEQLWVCGSGKITDLDGIQAARRLTSFTLWPSFTATITLSILSAVSSLENLEEYAFAGRTRDGSLEALNLLHNLKTVFFSNAYSWQEIARFEAHHPELNFSWKGGVTPTRSSSLKCENCGTPQSVLTGKGLKLACPSCDAGYIEKHLKRYAQQLSNERSKRRFGPEPAMRTERL